MQNEPCQWDMSGLVAITAARASRPNVHCGEIAPTEMPHIYPHLYFTPEIFPFLVWVICGKMYV